VIATLRDQHRQGRHRARVSHVMRTVSGERERTLEICGARSDKAAIRPIQPERAAESQRELRVAVAERPVSGDRDRVLRVSKRLRRVGVALDGALGKLADALGLRLTRAGRPGRCDTEARVLEPPGELDQWHRPAKEVPLTQVAAHAPERGPEVGVLHTLGHR
jgi:hypothetical protein